MQRIIEPVTAFDGTPSFSGTPKHVVRLMLVFVLMLGLFTSLMHCATCDLAVIGNSDISIASSDNTATPPSPEPGISSCSGHCMSHVTTQQWTVVEAPAFFRGDLPPLGSPQLLASQAGIPPFKPPRV